MAATYPIAEQFVSLQGEGRYTGTLMQFIRLAGCNVGRRLDVRSTTLAKELLLPVFQKHHVCETAVGQEFMCDTDYGAKYSVTIVEMADLILKSGVKHICLTGGEPLLHDVLTISALCTELEVELHVETSGTKEIPVELHSDHVACSPKVGFLVENWGRIDEYKFVIGPDGGSAQDIVGKISGFFAKGIAYKGEEPESPFHPIETPANPFADVYVQPANELNTVNRASLATCMAVVQLRPHWAVSFQSHKLLNLP
jgi:organic radical activating enzyme